MSRRKAYANITVPTVAAVEAVLKTPAEDWQGRCHEVACGMLEAKLVCGVERYGHYYGPVREGYYRAGLPFYRHGWIEAAPGIVIDPTRWVFAACKPYIYVGPDDDYDPGGNRLRDGARGPYPWHKPLGDSITVFDAAAYEAHEAGEVTKLGLPEEAMIRVTGLTNGHGESFSFSQLFWLANLPPDWYGPHARAVYEALERAGQKALIPFDNWRMVMGRPMAENRDDQEAAAAGAGGRPRRRRAGPGLGSRG